MVSPAPSAPLDRAFRTCARFARDHYENFPVASRLLPAAMRPHVAAVYAFARVADDFADEGSRPAAERLALLDAWGECLRTGAGTEARAHWDVVASAGSSGPGRDTDRGGPGRDRGRSGPGRDTDHSGPGRPCPGRLHPGLPAETSDIFAALGHTVQSCRLPVSLLEDLLSAFRQDVTVRRYATWGDVLDYCRRSANPVGRLVLRISGHDDEALDRSSDAVCTALQLTNFWQDLARDWANGRLYLPEDACRREGADTADLDAGRMTPPWQRVLGEAARRTSGLFDEGRLVCDRVRGRLGLELRLTWLGGRRVLERLQRGKFDVFNDRPTLGPADGPALLWRLSTWRRA